MVKVVAVILFFMLVRWSWPRFRFDQLMAGLEGDAAPGHGQLGGGRGAD